MLASSGIGLKLWNNDTFELVKEFPFTAKSKQAAQINSFQVKPDNTQIATVVDLDFIRLIDFEQKTQLDISDINDAKCCAYAYDSGGRYLAIGNSKGSFDLFDFRSGAFRKRNLKIPSSTCVNCMCFSKNDRFIATGNSNGTVCLYNNNTNMFSKALIHQNHLKHPPNVTSVSVSAVSIGSSYEDGSVVLWDPSKEQASCVFKEHNSCCTSFVFSPLNGILAVSGGLDNLFIMYDTSSKKAIKAVSCPSGITSLDILKDGYTIGIGTTSGYLLKYDLRNPDSGPLLSVKAHESSVYCVKFIQAREKLSVINNNLQVPNENSINSMRRSNSYNNESINPKINYNIYSPEPTNNNYNHAHINSSTSSESAGQTIVFQNNQTNSGESFILHKKSSTNNLSNIQNESSPMPSNNTIELTSNNLKKPEIPKTNFIKQANVQIRSKITNETLSPISSNHHGNSKSDQILSSTAQATPNGTHHLESTKNTKIQIDESNCVSNKTIKISTPRLLKSPSRYATTSQDAAAASEDTTQSNQLITLPVEQLKELMKETVKEALKDYNEQLNKIREEVDDFRYELMSENLKFKMEIFKEFSNLEEKMSKKLENTSLNPELLEEIARLKEENRRLKKQF